MSGPRYRPKRRLRSEFFPLLAVCSVPAALYFAFPRGAIGFRPEVTEPTRGTVCEFAVLGRETEAKLLAAARAAWQNETSGTKGLRADLLACDFEDGIGAAGPGLVPPRHRRLAEGDGYEPSFIPASVAAPPPAELAPVPAAEPAPAFPRAELLRLD